MHRSSNRHHLLRRTLRKSAVSLATVAASGLLLLTPLHAPVNAAPLAPQTVRQMMANDPGTSLRVTMNRLTQEHVYLAGAATGAAIGGRQAEYQAAAAELDENSVATAKNIGAVYGPDAEQAFLKLWREHIGYFADYAMGAARSDQAMKQQARQNLDEYRMAIDELLTGANPNLPKGAVAELFKPHVEHLTAAIDAQAAGNAPLAYEMLHTAAHQSREITDPLVDAIIAQFPERFGSMARADGASPDQVTQQSTSTVIQQRPHMEGGDITEGLSNDHPAGEEENGDDSD